MKTKTLKQKVRYFLEHSDFSRNPRYSVGDYNLNLLTKFIERCLQQDRKKRGA